MRRALIPAIAVVAVACSAFTPEATRTTIPTPTEFVIPTPTPKPSPTAFTGHYGFLVSGPNGYTVRMEGSDVSLGVINLFAGAVSPDGRLFAGWTRTTPAELRIVDVSKPTAFSKVLSLPASEGGGGVVWSVDGTGIVYSAESAATDSAGLPQYSALRLVDLTASGTAASAPREIARVEAMELLPALWDRLGGDLVAALGVVPGSAREYIVVRGANPPERKTLPDKTWQETPAASGDGRFGTNRWCGGSDRMTRASSSSDTATSWAAGRRPPAARRARRSPRSSIGRSSSSTDRGSGSRCRARTSSASSASASTAAPRS